ncbi:MAG: Cycloartenol synthase [Verrucomicrobiales bacterium]|nr:Cycloartenol synthase [Verrucomicrobiales bacterium]
MTRRFFTSAATATAAVLALSTGLPLPASAQGDVSLKNEVQAAITKGLRFLASRQNAEKGYIGDPDYPAITALAAMAMRGNPEADRDTLTPVEKKAYDYLLSVQKEDGGIYTKALPNYNTSLALTALTMVDGAPYREAGIRARRLVIAGQYDDNKDGQMNNPQDGGIGYGSKPPTDMSNTHLALEALHLSKKLLADDPDRAKDEPKLNYAAAIQFVSRCQNLTATNDQSWASDDKNNKGGFVYRPGDSKAGTEDLGNGKTAVRSYASMSYAGLLAFIYTEVKPNDPRVTSVKDWLAAHYSVTENPGMGAEGLYYYYHTMAKALNLAGIQEIDRPDGTKANWRLDLSRQLFNLQNTDGSWSNANARWMEKDPDLSTAYALLALEHIARGL